MPGSRLTPQPAQQPGDDRVLLGLGPPRGGRSGQAPLEQEGGGVGKRLGGVEAHGAVTGPGPEPVGLVVGLVVRPAHLEHKLGAGRVARRCHPGAVATWLERLTHGQPPSGRHLAHDPWQRRQPVQPPISFGGAHQIPGHGQWLHCRPSCCVPWPTYIAAVVSNRAVAAVSPTPGPMTAYMRHRFPFLG